MSRNFSLLVSAVLASAGFCCAGATASANDGGISMGGSPGLLGSHPSVRMASELIKISVRGNRVRADCRFVFVNSGPACRVRMGFPDRGEGADDPDEESDPEKVMKTPPHTTFDSFASWVDGRPVGTRLIRADLPGSYWHAKTVRFPGHSAVHIRDVYTQTLGGGIVSAGGGVGSAAQVAYVLHTGASWHGAIGRTEVAIELPDPKPSRQLMLRSTAAASISGNGRDLRGRLPSENTVIWKGPCTPTVSGSTIRFVRTNWRPVEADDIELTYGFKGIAPR